MKLRGFEIISSYKKRNITLPTRKTALSAGYDIALCEDIVLQPKAVTLVPTGLKAYMQDDEYLGIHIRSSLAVKHNIYLINSQGIIDADYYNNPDNEGHILIAVYNNSNEEMLLNAGYRIAQGIFYKYLITDDDNNGQEQNIVRSGGFGSTGK